MDSKLSHKEKTRIRILDEAASAIQVNGSERIGVADVMKRAGLTHGGFYAHFSSRDDLVAHAIDRMFRHSDAMIRGHRDGADPGESLVMLVDYYLSDEVRKTTDHVCPLPGLAGEARHMPHAARDRFNRGVQDFRTAIAAVLRALGKEEPEMLAISVLAEMVGAMALARAAHDDRQGSEILQASRLSLRQRLGLVGMQPASPTI